MASIDDLKGVISSKNGVARSNLFNVILPVYTKAGLRISSASTPYEMNILCRDVNLPGRQTLTRDRVYGLQRRKIAYGFAQDDVSLTFLLLQDYGAKKYFEDWKQAVVNQNSLEINYHDDYVADVIIQQLNKDGNPIYTCRLLEAFPTTMTALQFNNEQDGLLEFNLQLSYTNWTGTFHNVS